MAQVNGIAPVLPVAPATYDAHYMSQLLNVLRSYYSQGDSNLGTVNNTATSAQTLVWMNANG